MGRVSTNDVRTRCSEGPSGTPYDGRRPGTILGGLRTQRRLGGVQAVGQGRPVPCERDPGRKVAAGSATPDRVALLLPAAERPGGDAGVAGQ
jgi:hypothetical protein